MSHDRSCIRKFLKEEELAERWRKSRRTLQRWRSGGTGPVYHVINGSILYDLNDVVAFEQATRVVPKS